MDVKALLISLIVFAAWAPLSSVALDRPPADAMAAGGNTDEAVLAYQRRLDDFLRLGDFEGARSLVETAARALTANDSHSSAIAAMYKRIRDEKAREIAVYTTQIKEAVNSGDLAAAEKHAAQLVELSSGKAHSPGRDREAERWHGIGEPYEGPIGPSAIQIAAEAEASIRKRHLTKAPAGSRTASDSIRELADLVGDDHPDVHRLADLVIATYRALIDRRAEKDDYHAALEYLDRMEAMARTYRRPVNQADSLRTRLSQSHRVRQQYDDLLQTAKSHLDGGRLIAPAGANALEVASRAERLRPERLEVAELVDTVIALHEDDIDALVAREDLQRALSQTNQLVAMLRQWQPHRAIDVSRLERRASRLRRIDDPGPRPASRKATMQPREPGVAPEGGDGPPGYTYVTPF